MHFGDKEVMNALVDGILSVQPTVQVENQLLKKKVLKIVGASTLCMRSECKGTYQILSQNKTGSKVSILFPQLL